MQMTEPSDQELLAEFAGSESNTAFAALVARYVNLVHSTAMRATSNPHHAEEITQAVFVILVGKAGKLPPNTVLSGWLYQTARLTAANFMKGEIRRHKREQEAYMQSTLNEPDGTWKQIAPMLDEAMGRLGEADRNAIVLRFFENKTAQETGAALKITEAAAHKRVNRALEKLRRMFTKRGLALPAALIASAVTAHTVQAAPPGLAAAAAATAAKGASISTAITMLVKGTMKTMTWLKLKFAAGVCLAALITGGVATIAISQTGDGDKPPATQPKLGTMGFAGVLEVHSVSVSASKIVFVVSGPCELLLNKVPDAGGNAQVVPAVADHTAVVWYRTGRTGGLFATEEAWRAECERVKALVGKGIYFHTTGERLTWEGADLTLVVADDLVVRKYEGK